MFGGIPHCLLCSALINNLIIVSKLMKTVLCLDMCACTCIYVRGDREVSCICT